MARLCNILRSCINLLFNTRALVMSNNENERDQTAYFSMKCNADKFGYGFLFIMGILIAAYYA